MTWFVTPFADNPFMVRALVGGILVAVSCAIAGTFMVLRGTAFLGDALAHGVLPGVAGAMLLGLPGSLGAAAGAVTMIGGVQLVTRRSRLGADTAIGLLFVGMLALGVILASSSQSLNGDVLGLLFGDILGVDRAALIQQTVTLVAVGGVAALFHRPLLLLAFDRSQADLAGWPAARYELLMMAMITACVVMSFRTVGTLLVFGMLLAPGGAGVLIGRRLGTMVIGAVAVGAVSVYAGLLASYHFDLAAGATIVAVAVAQFFAILAVTSWRTRRPGTSA